MTALTDFLLARIAEDEAIARDAITSVRMRWSDTVYRWTVAGGNVAIDDGAQYVKYVAVGGHGEDLDEIAHQIVRWQPTRVLAACGVARQIVEEHTCPCPDPECGDCGACSGNHHSDPTPAPCRTLRLLAVPYASHESFLDAWRLGEPAAMTPSETSEHGA